MKARPRVGLIVRAPQGHPAQGHEGMIVSISLDNSKATVQWYYNVGDNTPQPTAAAPALSEAPLRSGPSDQASPIATANDNTLFT